MGGERAVGKENTKNNNNIIGERIRKMRKENRLKQDDVAKALGYTGRAIGNYEKGERVPGPKTIAKLAQYFDCTSDYLLGLDDNPIIKESGETYKVQDIKDELFSLDDEQLKLVTEIIKAFKEKSTE